MIPDSRASTVGSSSITPTPWPAGRLPTSGRPSTRVALVSMGALAAITSWLHVRSWLRRMDRPSRTSSRRGVPVSLRNCRAERRARGSRVTGEADSRRSTTGVRMTRWGAPSMDRVTTVSVTAAWRYSRFTPSGTVLSWVRRKRVPMATPSAPHARAATSPLPSWNPPAPSTGMAPPTASTTWGRSRLVGTTPVWPPPSAPWAMTASTPHSAIFSAWRRAPTVGMHSRPPSWIRSMASLVGAPAKLTRGTPRRTARSMRRARSGWSARKLTPNGLDVRALTSRTASSSCSKVMVTAARIPSPPAALVAAVRRGPDTQPIPVCTMGKRMPKRSHARVRSDVTRRSGVERSAELAGRHPRGGDVHGPQLLGRAPRHHLAVGPVEQRAAARGDERTGGPRHHGPAPRRRRRGTIGLCGLEAGLYAGENVQQLALASDQAGQPVPEVEGGPGHDQGQPQQAAGDDVGRLLPRERGVGRAVPAGDDQHRAQRDHDPPGDGQPALGHDQLGTPSQPGQAGGQLRLGPGPGGGGGPAGLGRGGLGRGGGRRGLLGRGALEGGHGWPPSRGQAPVGRSRTSATRRRDPRASMPTPARAATTQPKPKPRKRAAASNPSRVLRGEPAGAGPEGLAAGAAPTEGSAAAPAAEGDGEAAGATAGEAGPPVSLGAVETAATVGAFTSKAGAEATETRAPPKLAVKTFWLPGGFQKKSSEPAL